MDQISVENPACPGQISAEINTLAYFQDLRVEHAQRLLRGKTSTLMPSPQRSDTSMGGRCAL
jgi:hypothetical protein